ncbi:hypothetical protein ABH922_003180 [Rhodococcus sp. 27YEA15]
MSPPLGVCASEAILGRLLGVPFTARQQAPSSRVPELVKRQLALYT